MICLSRASSSSSSGQRNVAKAKKPSDTPNKAGVTPLKPSERSPKMTDPFAIRLQYSNDLQKLNASVASSQKVANYALRYREHDEDLHSCVLEQLERSNMNVRANIMYFIEHLCELAQREGHQEYIRMMQRDILQVVDSVAPEDGSGAANIKVVRKVLTALQVKGHLSAQTLRELEECLQSRGNESAADNIPDRSAATTKPRHSSTSYNVAPRLDKKQVEQRIEEDRERHKRARESIWSIPFKNNASVIPPPHTAPPEAGSTPSTIVWDRDPEFEKLYDETSDMGEDDYDLFEEEHQERKKAVAAHEEEYRSLTNLGTGIND